MANRTSYEIRVSILSELIQKYRQDPILKEFIELEDLGLPLAYLISTGVVETTEKAQKFLDDSFEGLLQFLEIPEDEGFKDLDDLLAESSWDAE